MMKPVISPCYQRLKKPRWLLWRFAAHDGLWQAAEETKDDLLGRLAIAPLILEARGLDVTPSLLKKFYEIDDHDSAAILEVIMHDEVGHVGTGKRWFDYQCGGNA